MNSRADGLNVHGAVDGLTLQNSHIENSGDDCIGIWSTGIRNMSIWNMTAKDCSVTAGAQGVRSSASLLLPLKENEHCVFLSEARRSLSAYCTTFEFCLMGL